MSQLCNSKGDAIKECYAALLSFLVEAARHDADPDTLSVTLLQNYSFSAQRSEKLVGMYRQHKTKLQAALSHIGTHPPHIIDASWTLDYCVKVSQHSEYIELVIQKCWCNEEVPASISSSWLVISAQMLCLIFILCIINTVTFCIMLVSMLCNC